MNNIVNDIRKLQDSLEKLYNTSAINFNGNIGQTSSAATATTTTNQLLKDDIRILLDVLECPVFESILNVQYSIQQLREQFNNNPAILPVDFDIDPITLELKLNPIPNDDNNNVSIAVNQQQLTNNKQLLNGKHHHPTTITTTTTSTYNHDNNERVVGGNGNDHFDDYDNRTIPSKFSLQQYMYENQQQEQSLGRDYCEPDYVNISSQ
ncbi:hypothetical protein BLA29_010008, partial [Euroglyphus maynei]